jgi:hypothetical protein
MQQILRSNDATANLRLSAASIPQIFSSILMNKAKPFARMSWAHVKLDQSRHSILSLTYFVKKVLKLKLYSPISTK